MIIATVISSEHEDKIIIYLSLTEQHYLVEHVEDLQPGLVDGQDHCTIRASHAMEVCQELQ